MYILYSYIFFISLYSNTKISQKYVGYKNVIEIQLFLDPFTILLNCAFLEQYFMADNSFTGLNKILFVTQGKKKD